MYTADAEAAGDVDGALGLYAGVLRRDSDNRAAPTGRQRVQATLVRERLQEGNAAFTAGRYDDARRNFQDAFELNGSPATAEGLRRVDNAEAVLCRNDAACGTLVVRVAPAAEIIVDDRSLGTTAVLELRLPAGRHRIRLETDEWRFPRTLEIAAGETAEIAVDLEEDGVSQVTSLHRTPASNVWASRAGGLHPALPAAGREPVHAGKYE